MHAQVVTDGDGQLQTGSHADPSVRHVIPRTPTPVILSGFSSVILNEVKDLRLRGYATSKPEMFRGDRPRQPVL